MLISEAYLCSEAITKQHLLGVYRLRLRMKLESSKDRWQRFRRDVLKSPLCRNILNSALCRWCALFIGDILTQEVWARPLPWWSGNRFKHRRAKSFPLDPQQIDCPLCKMLVIAWRQGSTYRTMNSTSGQRMIQIFEAMGEGKDAFDDRISIELEDISEMLVPNFRVEGIEMGITVAGQSGFHWIDRFFSQKRYESSDDTLNQMGAPTFPIQPIENGPLWIGENETKRALKVAQVRDPYTYSPDPTKATLLDGDWKPELLALDSVEAFSQIRRWLAECLEHHATCKRQPLAPLPTRVIDVGEKDHEVPRLHITNGHNSPYLALSYCWGEEKSTVLTTETLELFQSSIPSDAMPPTIRDAFKVTRELGYRYIWIDSLNIIQDSVDDWKAEAQKMRKIYEYADLVIAGDESYSRSVGIFTPRSAQVTREPTKDGSHLIVQRRAGIFKKPNDFYLSFRGWTLQESVLARAIIHFNSTYLWWECQHHKVVETEEPVLAQDLVSISQDERADRWDDLFLSRTSPTPWYHFVTNFSLRQLSFGSDAPAALAGVAELCEHRGWHSGRYLCGLWEDDLPQALLWSTERGSDMVGFMYDFPSWSWFDHVNRKVSWPLNFRRREQVAESPFDCIYHSSKTFVTSESRIDSSVFGELALTGYILPFDESLLQSIVSCDIEPWSNITMHKIRHLSGGDFREPGLALDHMQAWCSIGHSRVWKTLRFPLSLVRICSWPTLRESRLGDGYDTSEEYLDSYFLLLENSEKTDDMNSEASREEGNKWNRPWELEEPDRDPSMPLDDYLRESMRFLRFVTQGEVRWMASKGIHGNRIPSQRYPSAGASPKAACKGADPSLEKAQAEPNEPHTIGYDASADTCMLSSGQPVLRCFRKVGVVGFTHDKDDNSFMQNAVYQRILLL